MPDGQDQRESRSTLTPEEEAELKQLCEEYATTSALLRKEIATVGNPPEPLRVQIILDAETKAASILTRIKKILGADRS